MKTATDKRIAFRNMLKSGEIIVAPGIGDALSAKIAAYAGIKALTMGGYSVSASRLGQPDVGFLSCTEMAEQLTGICNATDLPVVADGDTGYGNALNVIRTEQMFEQAGAACIFFEDQAWPKRCGHMDGKQVISAEEHAQKIRAAVDARLDKETMIMSRTDSAEICFADGIGTREELEKFAKELSGSGAYLVANMIEGGKTPLIPAKELEQMGFSLVFWACSAVYTISKALYDLFGNLAQDGTTEKSLDRMIEFSQFNSMIGLDTYKEYERKYKVDRDD